MEQHWRWWGCDYVMGQSLRDCVCIEKRGGETTREYGKGTSFGLKAMR